MIDSIVPILMILCVNWLLVLGLYLCIYLRQTYVPFPIYILYGFNRAWAEITHSFLSLLVNQYWQVVYGVVFYIESFLKLCLMLHWKGIYMLGSNLYFLNTFQWLCPILLPVLFWFYFSANCWHIWWIYFFWELSVILLSSISLPNTHRCFMLIGMLLIKAGCTRKCVAGIL